MSHMDVIEAMHDAPKPSGLRKVCAYCKAELEGSDTTASRVSHGMCNPPCEAACAMGWGECVKPKVGAAAAIIVSAIVVLSFVSCAHAQDKTWNRILDGIALVESGNNHRAIGDGGKARGAFQFHRAAWAESTRLPYSAASTDAARAVAYCYLTNLHSRLVTATGTNPTVEQLYAAWNLGFAGFRRRDFLLSKCPAVTQRAAAKLRRYISPVPNQTRRSA